MEPSTSATPAPAQDTDPGAPPPKPIGPFVAWLLVLAAWAVMVVCVFAILVVAFLLGGNPVLATVLLLLGMFPSFYLASKVLDYRRRRLGIDQALAELDLQLRRHGLRRSDDAETTFDVPTAPFDLAGRHTAVHTWTGRYGGYGVAAVHYLVDTGTSDHHEREVYTVVAATGGGDVPLTEAVPQRGVTAVAAKVGQDLDVESAEFNDTWRVSTADERAAHALLTPRVIERMLREADDQVRTLWSGPLVLTVERGAVLDPEVLARRIRFVSALAGLVPGFARTDGGASGAPAAEGARAEVTARRARTRGWTEMVLLLLALVALFGGARGWLSFGPEVGVPILLVGLVLANRSTRIAAWIDRRRGKR